MRLDKDNENNRIANLALRLKDERESERPDTSYKQHKDELFLNQAVGNGRQAECRGCREFYLKKDLQVDHIKPQSHGGGHEVENLQLLCSDCNSRKSNGTMADLRESLLRDGIIQ